MVKAASKSVNSLFKENLPSVSTVSTLRIADGSKDEAMMKAEHLEVLHVLNVVKLTVPHLSSKVSLEILSELSKLMSSEFSPITRHIFNIIAGFYGSLKIETVIPETESIVVSLASYLLLRENPMDTVISAATLLKKAMDKLHYEEDSRLTWINKFPVVCGSFVGKLFFFFG